MCVPWNKGFITNPARRAEHEESVFYHATELTNANCPIHGDRVLDLGGCSANVLLTPGHTSSNISIYVPEDGVLFCGDCLTSGYLLAGNEFVQKHFQIVILAIVAVSLIPPVVQYLKQRRTGAAVSSS